MSKEVGTFELKGLILIEEFKSCCTRELKLHLEELKLGPLQENAISHRNLSSHIRWRSQKEFASNPKEDDSKKDDKDDSKPRDESPKKGKNRGSPRGSPTRYGKKLNCYFCKKLGHVRAD